MALPTAAPVRAVNRVIIRMGYGADDLYTRWSRRALSLWQEFAQRTGQTLFHRTGVLWMARQDDLYSVHTEATLQRLGIPYEALPGRCWHSAIPTCG